MRKIIISDYYRATSSNLCVYKSYLEIVASASSHHRALRIIHSINHHYKIYMRVLLLGFKVSKGTLYSILILKTNNIYGHSLTLSCSTLS